MAVGPTSSASSRRCQCTRAPPSIWSGPPRLAAVAARGLTGHLDATIDAAGALAAPTLALAVTGRDVGHAQLGRVRLAGRSSFSGTRALIDTLDVDAAAGSLHAEGAIELGEPPPRAAGAGKPCRPALVESPPRRSWSDVRPIAADSNRFAGAWHGHRRFRPPDLEARAWSRLRAAATTTLQEPPRIESSRESLSLSGRAELQLERGGWSLRHSIEARSAQADLAGQLERTSAGRRRRPALDARRQLAPSRGGYRRLAALDAGRRREAAARRDRRSRRFDAHDSRSRRDAGKPACAGRSRGRNLRSRVWPHTANLDARLALDTNAVRALSVRATAGTTSLQASGRYSWRGPFDARVELRQGDLSAARPSVQRAGDDRRIGATGRHHLRHALERRAPRRKAC